jgi:predicted kinase
MLITMSGLPGSGKSALAKELARALGISVFSVDPIESALLHAGMQRSFETGLAAYLVAEALAGAQLEIGQGAIIDAVNAVEPAKNMWRELARTHHTPLRVIECRCSDEAMHRTRLASRHRGLHERLKEPTWADVQARRAEQTPWKEPVFEVDSICTLEENVARVLAWLRRGGS